MLGTPHPAPRRLHPPRGSAGDGGRWWLLVSRERECTAPRSGPQKRHQAARPLEQREGRVDTGADTVPVVAAPAGHARSPEASADLRNLRAWPVKGHLGSLSSRRRPLCDPSSFFCEHCPHKGGGGFPQEETHGAPGPPAPALTSDLGAQIVIQAMGSGWHWGAVHGDPRPGPGPGVRPLGARLPAASRHHFPPGPAQESAVRSQRAHPSRPETIADPGHHLPAGGRSSGAAGLGAALAGPLSRGGPGVGRASGQREAGRGWRAPFPAGWLHGPWLRASGPLPGDRPQAARSVAAGPRGSDDGRTQAGQAVPPPHFIP